MDMSQFNAKERKQTRKDLIKKIGSYNKHARNARRPSFPLTSPSKDLIYKGVVKVSYDRGYALQTKSILMESTTTSAEVVEQLFESLGLRGSSSDYALEERNLMTGVIRLLGSMEIPLTLQLDYGSQMRPYMDLRLVQMKDSRSPPPSHSRRRSSHRDGNDSDDTLSEEGPIVAPKEEVIDHGIASVELVLEEALQDIPPLVYDIQERLKVLSETVAVDGKPAGGLPSRRLLWDVLKPQASALVKDIRRLVDNGEFLANRYCSSPAIKLIATLVLELITDHSRELVTVTKEMCGLRGAAKTEFASSVSKFTQQVTYISKLVGKMNDTLHAMALADHLLGATSPGKFQKGSLQSDSYVTGSGSISGVLMFTVVSAYLGLVRAAYEEKTDYYASLATNMLRSSQRALEVVQKTEEYSMMHLHPLRSRVRDMEHKLKVAMDNLIRGVKVAASSRPTPVAAAEMLLYGHALIMATLDFLMVAQCASLLVKVEISGWDLLQLPWVSAIADKEAKEKTGTVSHVPPFTEQLSSVSDSASSSSSQSYPKGEKSRPSRIPTHPRESGDGMDAADLKVHESPMARGGSRLEEGVPMRRRGAGTVGGGHLSFSQFGLRASQLKLPYYREDEDGGEGGRRRKMEEDEEDSGADADDEVSRTPGTLSPLVKSDNEDGLESGNTSASDISFRQLQTTSTPVSRSYPTPQHPGAAMATGRSRSSQRGSARRDSSEYMGTDAIRKLRLHYNINKALAKGAEALLLTVTQKINVLSVACRDGARDKYAITVENIIAAAKQIREEVSTMEVDLLVGQSITESLDRSKTLFESAVREVQLSTLMASSSVAPDSAGMKLMAAVGHLKDVCSKTVANALTTAGEHKKALEQAERIEQEFVSLMTGRKEGRHQKTPPQEREPYERRKFSSPAKLAMADETHLTGIVFEERGQSSYPVTGKTWTTKEPPKVIGGTLKQLVQRLTYHRVIDSEFTETFLLTFYSFMTPEELLDALIARYQIAAPKKLTEWETDMFEVDVAIPVRLRVIHAVRTWLNYSYDDFKEKPIVDKLHKFIRTVDNSMTTCAEQLKQLLEENLKNGPAHARSKPRGQPPTPLVPMGLSQGGSFDILDVNTLELSRQLTLAYSRALREIRPQELLSLGWTDEVKVHLVPNIMKILQMSKNLSVLICRQLQAEPMEDDQASVISYFVQTAKHCLDLKNFEAVFAIMNGLEGPVVQQAENAWQMLTDNLTGTYEDLKEMVSPEINHHRYRQDIRIVHQSPVIPHLALILSDLEAVDKDHLDFLTQSPLKDIVNFQKRRQQARVIQQMQRYQSSSYNLYSVEVMQRYLNSLAEEFTDDDIEQLSTTVKV